MYDPAFTRLDPGAPPPPDARSTSDDGFRALAREERLLDAMRADGLVLALPGDGEKDRRLLRLDPATDDDVTRAGDVVVWREEGRSPVLDVDPLHRRALVVRARPSTSTASPPRVGWRVSDEVVATGVAEGVWIAGQDGPVAVFDLAAERGWLLGGRGKRLWTEGELSSPLEAQLSSDLPPVAGVRAPDTRGGEDWTFDPEVAALPKPVEEEAYAELVLFDRHGFHLRRLAVEVDGARWHVPGAEALVSRWEHLPEGLTWALEWRTEDACLARSRGH